MARSVRPEAAAFKFIQPRCAAPAILPPISGLPPYLATSCCKSVAIVAQSWARRRNTAFNSLFLVSSAAARKPFSPSFDVSISSFRTELTLSDMTPSWLRKTHRTGPACDAREDVTGPAALCPSMLPIRTNLVVVKSAIAIGAPIVLGELFDRAGGRSCELILREAYNVTLTAFFIVKFAPRDRVIFLANAHQPAESDNREHDVVRRLVQDHVLDLSDFLARSVEDVGVNDFACADC